MAQICIDSNVFYTVMVVGVAIIVFTLTQQVRPEFKFKIKTERSKSQPQSKPDIDMLRFLHPLTPPVRRSQSSFPYTRGIFPINTPTRGEYGPFHTMGYLYNTDDQELAMPLIGRRIHSNKYEYYTFHHKHPEIKIPINITGDKEINHGDTVNISSYPDTNFTVSIYETDVPRYVPY